MKRLCSNLIKRESGQTMLETAMLLPWLFIILFGITQLSLYLYSRNVVHYAAFAAARSYIALGEKKLSEINYGYNKNTRVAEAAAEKIIFESLPWEQNRIEVRSGADQFKRAYFDPNGSAGAVSLNLRTEAGEAVAELTYCMPLMFNLTKYFIPAGYHGDCSNVTKASGSGSYMGLPIKHIVKLQMNL